MPIGEPHHEVELTYEERTAYECKICGNVPDVDGTLQHGKGCYSQDENGEGISHIVFDEFHEVHRPSHYNSHPYSVEQIHYSTHMNFNLGNAFKYLWRAGLKGDELVDLQKALFYLNEEVARVTKYQAPVGRMPPKLAELPVVLKHWSENRRFIMKHIALSGFSMGRSHIVYAIGRLKQEIGELINSRNKGSGGL